MGCSVSNSTVQGLIGTLGTPKVATVLTWGIHYQDASISQSSLHRPWVQITLSAINLFLPCGIILLHFCTMDRTRTRFSILTYNQRCRQERFSFLGREKKEINNHSINYQYIRALIYSSNSLLHITHYYTRQLAGFMLSHKKTDSTRYMSNIDIFAASQIAVGYTEHIVSVWNTHRDILFCLFSCLSHRLEALWHLGAFSRRFTSVPRCHVLSSPKPVTSIWTKDFFSCSLPWGQLS